MNIIIMPKQGLQMTEGTITSWLVPVGGQANAGEPLFEMETDKLTITINSDFTGTLLRVLAEDGDTVPITAPIALIGDKEELGDAARFDATTTPPESAEPPTPTVTEAALPVPLTPNAPAAQISQHTAMPTTQTPEYINKPARGRIFATPRARMRAAERGADFTAVIGSGPDGLVIERDVLAYVTPSTVPAISTEKLWIRADFTAAASLIARIDGLDPEKFITRALCAALSSQMALTAVFGTIPVVVAVGVDGFETAQPETGGTVLSAAISSDGTVTFTLVYADPSVRDDAVSLLDRLRTLCELPELAFCV